MTLLLSFFVVECGCDGILRSRCDSKGAKGLCGKSVIFDSFFACFLDLYLSF